MSGGVDSAVSAVILRERGYEVHGLYLDIGIGGASEAIKLANELSIPLRVESIFTELESMVITPFAGAYLEGRTPNPCVRCNPGVKFPALIREADRIGAEYVATGHYAVVSRDDASGRMTLSESPHPNDQSYMLCRLTQDILSRVIFPLGALSKAEVRDMAGKLGLSVSKKPDSMEICFVQSGDYAEFIEKRMGKLPEGDFTDSSGRVLGKHRGIHHYTIGQRRGLGVSAGERLFVSEIIPESNKVVLSREEEIYINSIRASDIHWLSVEPIVTEFRAEVKLRHSKTKYTARLRPEGNYMTILLDTALRRPAPGQAAVFYSGSMLLGCATIEPPDEEALL